MRLLSVRLDIYRSDDGHVFGEVSLYDSLLCRRISLGHREGMGGLTPEELAELEDQALKQMHTIGCRYRPQGAMF